MKKTKSFTLLFTLISVGNILFGFFTAFLTMDEGWSLSEEKSLMIYIIIVFAVLLSVVGFMSVVKEVKKIKPDITGF